MKNYNKMKQPKNGNIYFDIDIAEYDREEFRALCGELYTQELCILSHELIDRELFMHSVWLEEFFDLNEIV